MWMNKSNGNEQQFMLYRLGIFLLDIQQGIFHFGDKAEVHEQLEVGEKQETL